MKPIIKGILSGVLPALLLGAVLYGYIQGCAPRHNVSLGPVAQLVTKEGRIDTPEQIEANSESMISFVHEMLSEQMPEVGISKDRISLLKGVNGYFRIMGGFESKKDETVLFIFVLKDGKEIYREIGNYVIQGSYPEGVFPAGMYFKKK